MMEMGNFVIYYFLHRILIYLLGFKITVFQILLNLESHRFEVPCFQICGLNTPSGLPYSKTELLSLLYIF